VVEIITLSCLTHFSNFLPFLTNESTWSLFYLTHIIGHFLSAHLLHKDSQLSAHKCYYCRALVRSVSTVSHQSQCGFHWSSACFWMIHGLNIYPNRSIKNSGEQTFPDALVPNTTPIYKYMKSF
jgi:hypothetical protein